jgi:pimeloyl-ACP methyl ester carboxylesterase
VRRAAAIVAVVLCGCVTSTPGQLRDRQYKALKAGDWFEAIKLGKARVQLEPSNPLTHYDLACALARAGDAPRALEELSAAVDAGFDAPNFLAKDEDLATLRTRPEFTALFDRAARLERDGAPINGIRTVVRDELVTPLRVRLPESAATKPRLAIWLHPFGARLNRDAEQLAPVLAREGFALAVPLRMTQPGWTEGDLHDLLDTSVPALADVVDVEKPLLIGFSAGCHAALAAWAHFPDRFAGVIGTGCAPELHGGNLPANGAPIVLLNGAEDAATPPWNTELPRWKAEGRRVSLTVIPQRGHEFLFEDHDLFFTALRKALHTSAP